jgi:adenylate cyclase
VLPFANLSGDPEQEFFADGITEDILTGLSQIREFFVIARNTMFTYKGRPVDVQALSTELGVRYVLEGSVRKAGGRVRITAQLNDGTNGRQIWADRYDRDLEDVFRPAGRDHPDRRRRARPGTEPRRAAACITQAAGESRCMGALSPRPVSFLQADAGGQSRGAALFRARDRTRRGLRARLCRARARALGRLDSARTGPRRRRRVGGRPARDGARRARGDFLSRLGIVYLLVRREGENALRAFQEALAINPNDAQLHMLIGVALTSIGRAEEAIPFGEQAIRRSPFDSSIGIFYGRLALSNLFCERTEQAIHWGQRAAQKPGTWLDRIALPAALALSGRRAKRSRPATSFAPHGPR